MSELLQTPVVLINARLGQGLDELKKKIAEPTPLSQFQSFTLDEDLKKSIQPVKERFPSLCDYQAYQWLQQHEQLHFLNEDDRQFLRDVSSRYHFFKGKYQGAETVQRYSVIQQLLHQITVQSPDLHWKKTTRLADKILVHPVWGYVLFFVLLFIVFQSIFYWAQFPMDALDSVFAKLSEYVEETFPAGPLVRLLAHGIIPGIGGILIFVPQIALLFFFVSLLEESGYMARVVFFDGQHHASLWLEWSLSSAAYFGLGMCHSLHHGYAND